MARPPPPEHSRFKPGQSGNPGGKPVGVRNKLAATFLKSLKADFDLHGKAAIEQAREKDVVGYLRVIAQVLPKQIEDVTERRELTDLPDDELIAIIRGGGASDEAEGPPEPADVH